MSNQQNDIINEDKREFEKDSECEVCGVKLDNENSEDTSRCFNCREEWGDEYPDRI